MRVDSSLWYNPSHTSLCQAYQSNQSIRSIRSFKSDKSNKSFKSDKSNKSYQLGQLDQSDQLDQSELKTFEWDILNPDQIINLEIKNERRTSNI